MPTVINGIGTWYYGRDRVHTVRAVCDYCRGVGDLTSYDTTLYFVVFFVPVIPLAKKRILEQCTRCQKHRVINARDWEAARAGDSAAVLERLRADPDDRDAILSSLTLALRYQDRPLFDRVAETLADRRRDDAEVQLLLGEGHEYFSRPAEAEAAFRQSLLVGDSPEARSRLGLNLLKQGRPDDAEPCLAHCYDADDGAGTLYWLVAGYQSQGRHDDALRVLDAVFEKWPDLAANKEWRKLQTTSTKYRGTAKRVVAPLLGTSKAAGYREGGWGPKVAKYAFPALVLAGLVAYVVAAVVLGFSREVYLLNGSPVPYVAAVNGAEYSLPPGRPVAVRVPEGEVRVAVRGPGLPTEEQTCVLETPFWSRPIGGRTFVLNPDRVAVLVREVTVYTERPVPVNEPDQHFTGRLLHEFDGFDYVFDPFPQTLKTKGHGPHKKTRLGVETPPDAESRLRVAAEGRSPAEVHDYARRWLAFQPDDATTLLWLASTLDPGEAETFLTPRLAERPIRAEWHRAYQVVVGRGQPDRDLIPEYRKLVEETRRSPDAVYLLARLCPHDEALPLFEEAARGNPPSHLAENALGYHALAEGRFDDAVRWCRQAVTGAPNQPLVEHQYEQALWAAKGYTELGGLYQKRVADHGDQIGGGLQQARLLLAQGDRAGAEAKLNDVINAVGSNLPDARQTLTNAFAVTAAAVARDPAAYLKTADTIGQMNPFYPALLRNQPPAAAAAVKEAQGSGEVTRWGLLYLCAERNGAGELATDAFDKLLASLRRGGREEREFADLLAGPGPMAEAVQLAGMQVSVKRVVVAVAARRFPKLRDELLPFARKLNFEFDAEGLCLAQELR